jgi:hypothetical protein
MWIYTDLIHWCMCVCEHTVHVFVLRVCSAHAFSLKAHAHTHLAVKTLFMRTLSPKTLSTYQ